MYGIYLHIPFCQQACVYCDFHFSTQRSYLDRMTDALCTEIQLRKDELQGKPRTLYFGGGTPSILEVRHFEQIFNTLSSVFDLSAVVECTVECNPEDIDMELLSALRRMGVDRLSLGIQSFDDRTLKWMHRAHDSRKALDSVTLARKAGFENITVDLIYGLPGMDLQRWKDDLSTAVDLGVEHLSTYCLTVEERTVLAKQVDKGLTLPSDEEIGQQFHWLSEFTGQHGFEHYEISNLARPGFRSMHNGAYWQGVDYLGIGPSAHSLKGDVRSWNVSHNHRYMKAMEDGARESEKETLSSHDRYNELLLTGLRRIEGVCLTDLSRFRILENETELLLQDFVERGWMVQQEDRIQLTTEGRLMADHITGELMWV